MTEPAVRSPVRRRLSLALAAALVVLAWGSAWVLPRLDAQRYAALRAGPPGPLDEWQPERLRR